MAAEGPALSFDDIIQAGRAQREKQKLADEIFGQGRKNNAFSIGSRKAGTGPSLASRVGISKPSQRSKSNTPMPKHDINAQWGHDLHRANTSNAPRITRPPRENPMARIIRNDLLYEAATRNGAAKTTIDVTPRATYGEEISIRGIAGPYVVIGSNFAPGTTAADIESAMVPSAGEMQKCRILSASPTVIAEMVFAEKQNAEIVISTFNNKKADGRILHVYMKAGGPSSSPASTPAPPPARIAARKNILTPIDLTRSDPPSYAAQREQSDRARRRADPEYQDGRYGFDAKDDSMDVDVDASVPVAPTAAPASANVSAPRSDRRDDRRGYEGRGYGREYGRGREYYARDEREGVRGRPREGQRLYSDGMYGRSRGRGYR